MSFTHERTITYKTDSGTVSNVLTKTSESSVEMTVSIPAETTDMEVDIAIDTAAVKSLLISADGALTIETNDGTTPDDTLAVDENEPLTYMVDTEDTLQLTVDVTKLYVTNAGAAAVTLDIRVLVDATP